MPGTMFPIISKGQASSSRSLDSSSPVAEGVGGAGVGVGVGMGTLLGTLAVGMAMEPGEVPGAEGVVVVVLGEEGQEGVEGDSE